MELVSKEDQEEFFNYLQNLGIIDGIKIAQIKNSTKKVIFALADYFKTLTPSDCYDLACRLQEKWQTQSNSLQSQQLQQQQIEFKTFGNNSVVVEENNKILQFGLQQNNNFANINANNQNNKINQSSDSSMQQANNQKNKKIKTQIPVKNLISLIQLIERLQKKQFFKQLNTLLQQQQFTLQKSQKKTNPLEDHHNITNSSAIELLQNIQQEFDRNEEKNPYSNLSKRPSQIFMQNSPSFFYQNSTSFDFNSSPNNNFNSPRNIEQQILNNIQPSPSSKNPNFKQQIQQLKDQINNNDDNAHNLNNSQQRFREFMNLKECTFRPSCLFSSESQSTKNIDKQSSQSLQSKVSPTNSIHNKLHIEGQQKLEKKREILKEIKNQLDLRECSFQPNTTQNCQPPLNKQNQKSSQQSVQSENNVFERLSRKSARSQERDQEKMKFREEEMKNCTFKPQNFSNSSSNQFYSTNLNNSRKNSLSNSQKIDRLYKEGLIKSQLKQEACKQLKENIELKQCTFKPQINQTKNWHNLNSINQQYAEDSQILEKQTQQPVFDKLYEYNKEKLKMQEEKQKQSPCSFQPKLVSQNHKYLSQVNDENQNPHDRLYKQGQEQNKKLRDMQKAKELEELNRFYKKSSNINQNQNKDEQTELFFERMKQFQQQKENNIQQINAETMRERGITFKPEINKKSQNLKNNKYYMKRSQSQNLVSQDSQMNQSSTSQNQLQQQQQVNQYKSSFIQNELREQKNFINTLNQNRPLHQYFKFNQSPIKQNQKLQLQEQISPSQSSVLSVAQENY